MWYRFKVLYWDTFEEEKAEDSGFLMAECYADAAEQIEDWYGEDLVAITYLYEMEDKKFLFDSDIDYANRNLK